MENLRSFFRRLTGSFSKDHLDAALNDELRAHLEMLTQENIAKGMDQGSARRGARLTLGGDAQIKDAYRAQAGLPWLDVLLQDLRYGFRYLRKNPGFTALAVITLALGIGANTAIFSVVYAVLLRPLPYAQPDQLVSLRGGQSWPDLDDIRRQNHTLSGIGAYWPAQFDLTGGAQPEQVDGASVSLDLFETLGVPPELGRVLNRHDDVINGPRLVVISHAWWQERFGGDRNVIGRALDLDGLPYEIVGVMPQKFWLPTGESRFWVPFRAADAEAASARGLHAQYAIARLKDGVSRAQAQADSDAIAASLAKLYPAENRDRRFVVMSLHERVVGPFRTLVLVLFAAVGMVLLIASLNFANLLLAKASARNEEMQIRAALGASPSRIVRQLLTESVLLSCIGGITGIVLAFVSLRVLSLLRPGDLPRLESVTIDGPVLLFAFFLALLTGAVFGLAPVVGVMHSKLQVRAAARQTGGTSHIASRIRQSLIVVEFTLALVLLCGAGLLLRSMARLQSVDIGFDTDNVLTARIALRDKKYTAIPPQNLFFDQLEQRLKAIPGVKSAALVTELPLQGNIVPHNVVFLGRAPVPEGTEPDVLTNLVSPDFFSTLQIRVLKGRALAATDNASAPLVTVINEAMARQYYPNEEPLGKQIAFARDEKHAPYTIVGVVANIKEFGQDQDDTPGMYTPLAQKQELWRRWSGIVVRSSLDSHALAKGVEEAVWSLDRSIPVTKIKPMSEMLTETLSQRRFTTLLLLLFAATALALALVGIYGLIAYSVVQRTREFGVRIALGAQRGNVLWIVLRQAVILGALGVALGTVGSFFASRAMTSLIFGIAPHDPPTYVSVALLLLIVALFAAFVPAWRATRIDPTTALRAE